MGLGFIFSRLRVSGLGCIGMGLGFRVWHAPVASEFVWTVSYQHSHCFSFLYRCKLIISSNIYTISKHNLSKI